MNILVFGLGALGTVYATFLKEAGHTVYGVTRQHHLQALERNRVKVSGIWGDHEASLDGIVDNVLDLKGSSFDLVILTVKSYDTREAVERFKDIVDEGTVVVVSQNGYGNYETVCEVMGREHVLLARVIFGSKVISTGHSEVTVIADDVKIGQPHGAIARERVEEIAATINGSGIPTSYADDVYALLWDKILYNCALNPLGAILGCSYGDLADHEGTRRIMDSIIKEIFLTARANSITLRWNSADAYKEHFYKNLVPPTRGHFPSMYYDLKEGKRTEIDALNGAVLGLARTKGVAVPVNQTITDLIKTRDRMSRNRR